METFLSTPVVCSTRAPEQIFFNSTNISQKLWHFSEEFLKAHCEFGIKKFHIFASNLWLIKFRFLATSPLLWTFYKMTEEKNHGVQELVVVEYAGFMNHKATSGSVLVSLSLFFSLAAVPIWDHQEQHNNSITTLQTSVYIYLNTWTLL